MCRSWHNLCFVLFVQVNVCWECEAYSGLLTVLDLNSAEIPFAVPSENHPDLKLSFTTSFGFENVAHDDQVQHHVVVNSYWIKNAIYELVSDVLKTNSKSILVKNESEKYSSCISNTVLPSSLQNVQKCRLNVHIWQCSVTSNAAFDCMDRFGRDSLLLNTSSENIRRYRVPPRRWWRRLCWRFHRSRHNVPLKLVIELDQCVGGDWIRTVIDWCWAWWWNTETITFFLWTASRTVPFDSMAERVIIQLQFASLFTWAVVCWRWTIHARQMSSSTTSQSTPGPCSRPAHRHPHAFYIFVFSPCRVVWHRHWRIWLRKTELNCPITPLLRWWWQWPVLIVVADRC